MKLNKVNHRQNGFSLVELLVVVAITGIVTAIAVPQFQTFQARAIRADADTSLANIATLQELYHTDNSMYGSLSAIGFVASTNSRYGYSITAGPSASAFTAQATTTNAICYGGVVDTVTVNQTGATTVASNGLAACD